MPRKPGDKLPDNPDELEGLTKAAILMLALEPVTAGEMLKHLPQESVEQVTRELAGLGRVTESLRDAVVEEFYHISMASQRMSEGGLDYAAALLKQSMDPKSAEKVLGQIQTQVRKAHTVPAWRRRVFRRHSLVGPPARVTARGGGIAFGAARPAEGEPGGRRVYGCR